MVVTILSLLLISLAACATGVGEKPGVAEPAVECPAGEAADGTGTCRALRNWYPDCDGDGVFGDDAVSAIGVNAADATFDCADGSDPDGGWSTVAGTDCNDEDATGSAPADWYPDCDGDGTPGTVATSACGLTGANAATVCADEGAPDGSWSNVAGTDCDDEDASGSAEQDWYPDCDGDGVSRGASVVACGATGATAAFDCEDGTEAAHWTTTVGVDCDDEDPADPCGCTMHDNDGDGLCEPAGSVRTAVGATTGVINLEMRSGSLLPVYVDGDFDGGGWVLVGRGREDWAWSDDGRGTPEGLPEGLGTPAAFAPEYLSASTIQTLIDNASLDLTDLEIRIRRAAAADGTAYQDVIWRAQETTTWTWLFDAAHYAIEYTVLPSVLGPGVGRTGNTRDVGNNDHRRMFTWVWNGHGHKTGFSYGASMNLGTNDADNFWWQHASESHSLPYSEVYVRVPRPASCLDILAADPAAEDGTYQVDPDGIGGVDAFAVTCDMTGGGYTVISTEDFSTGDAAGWQDAEGAPTPVDTNSSCGSAYDGLLGGYGILRNGDSTAKVFPLLGIPHTEISVGLDYVVLDSWNFEDGIVSVDGEEAYRNTFATPTAGEQICGGFWPDHGAEQVRIEQAHTGDTVTVEATSTLSPGGSDESFGIDNVVIRVR